MKSDIKTPRDFLNPLLAKKSIDKTKFDAFNSNLQIYVNGIHSQHTSGQSEPNIVSNTLQPFIQSLNYIAEVHSQKGQSGIDLAIKKEHKVSVVIEAKKYQDRDMITKEDLHKKSFYESILYFMRERHQGNQNIYHVIITDFYSWFVFDAKDFDKLFWQNKQIKKIFESINNNSLLGDRTTDFYDLVAKELPNLKVNLFDDLSIECAYFNLKNDNTEKELVAIYKLLSPDSLLKEFNP
ncbi:MAG: DUF7149 domain-containing protein, partial [Sulfurovum sp.]